MSVYRDLGVSAVKSYVRFPRRAESSLAARTSTVMSPTCTGRWAACSRTPGFRCVMKSGLAPENEDRFRQPPASASRSRRSAAARTSLPRSNCSATAGTDAVKAILPRQHPCESTEHCPRWRSQMSARSNRSATSGVELDDGLCPSQRANVDDRRGRSAGARLARENDRRSP